MSEPNLSLGGNQIQPMMNSSAMLPLNNGISNNGSVLSNRPGGPGPAPPPLMSVQSIAPSTIVKPRITGVNNSSDSSSTQSQSNTQVKPSNLPKNSSRTARTGQSKTNIKTSDRR